MARPTGLWILRACVVTLAVLALPAAATAQLVVGPAPGSSSAVQLIEPTGTRSVDPFPGFLGGVSLTLGDINGDGTVDIVVGAGPGGGSHVRVFSGTDLSLLASFFAFDPGFLGGVRVAAGDIDGDGRADLILGAGPGGGPQVRVLSGADFSDLASFWAFDPAFLGGVSVASGDVDGDGRADIVAGAGSPGGGPHVRVFSGADLSELASFFAFDPGFHGGLSVAAGDVDGDGLSDVITGAGPGGGPQVRVFSGLDSSEIVSFWAFDPAFAGGVNVAAGDYDGDGRVDLILGAGPGGGPHVRVLSGVDLYELDSFFAATGSGVSVGSVGDAASLRFTSAAATTFTVGSAGTFTVTTAGQPAPAITQSGTLPSGVTFTDNGAGTATLAGTPAAGTGGTYALTFTASNGTGTPKTQTFTLNVNQAPAITSAAATTFPVGAAATFSVTTTGFPVPTIARGGAALPAGITWVDNGDGTGTLGGTAAAGTGGTYALTFTASNGVGAPAVQAFTLTVNGAPAFTSANATTFTVGSAGTFTVTTVASPTAAISLSGALPAGVSFTDNGDGTGTLSGTPAAGTAGSYAITFTAANGALPNAVQAFTLNVQQPPAITSAASTTFTVGTPGTFTVTTTGFPTPTVSQTGTLPTGVTFTPATRVLGGTAAQTGAFPLVFTATNSVPPDATQNFTLNVVCPAITVNPATMTDGLYQVAYAGVTFTQTGSTGSSITWSATGLPAGLAIGPTTGVVSGTPTDTVLNGAVSITATDNFGCTGTRNTTITVRPTTDPENYTGGVGHTQYATGAPFPATPHVAFVDNVKTGDNGPGALSVTFPATSTSGAIVEGTTDGTFIYTPNLNFGGPSDTFTYTLTDGNGVTNTGTVTINLSNIVWYVNSSGGAGDGRSHSPFNTLNAAATPSGSTHIIYVHSGGATTTGNLAMDANQTLQGQGATFTLNGLTIPAGTRPTLTGTVTLADNTTVRAVNFTASGIPAMAASAVSFAQPVTIDQVNVTGGTSALSLTNVTATATGAINVSNAAFTNTSAAEVLISQGTIPVTLATTATISSNAGRSIDIQSRTGGTVTFSGPITDTGQGIFLSANTGSTINFTGGLALSTTTNPALTATGGGTVSATQNNTTIVNTITTTTGTALNVANTTIGGSGLTFRSINVDGNDSQPVNGIVLSGTGTLAGLTVTGTGGATSGGIIRDTAGDGILLTTTEAVSLSSISITSNLGNGIGGSGVHGFVLNGMSITDNGDDAAQDDAGIDLVGLTGTNGGTRPTSITNSTISSNHEFEVQITNSAGTLGNFIVTNTNMSSDGLTGESNQPTGDHGNLFNFLALGTATMTLTVTGGSFVGNAEVGCAAPNDTCTATAIHADASGGTMSVNIGGITATNNNVAINVSVALDGVLTFNVHDNTATNNRSHGLNLFVAANATGNVSGFFQDNVVGTLGDVGSGSDIGFPIRVQNEADTGTAINVTVQISDNTVQESASFNLINVNQGIAGNGGTASPTFVTITNNTLRNSGARGITFQQNNNNNTTGSSGVSCASISGNTFTGTFVGQAGDGSRLRLRQLAGGTFQANQTTPAGFVSANTGLIDAQVSIGGTLTLAASCPTP